MRTGTRTAKERRSATPRRHRHEEAPPAPECGPQSAAEATSKPPQSRERVAGGPEDRALYVCRCGSAFQAVVTASVRCPHCGETQAW